MGKVIVKSAIKRQKGKLYYIDANGSVCEASMNRKGGKKGRHVCSTKKAAPKKRKPAATKKKAVVRKKRRTQKKENNIKANGH